MDVAMALAVLFFCLLLLCSAAIVFLLLRHLFRPRRRPRGADPEAISSSVRQAPIPSPPSSPPQQEQPLMQLQQLLSWAGEEKKELKEKEMKEEEAEGPRKLTWREVEALTGGFDEAAVVGRGGSSTVYLAGVSPSSSPVAVKVHRWCGGGERRLRAFRQELDLLRRLRHPHIVSLLAYSDNHEEGGALVLEYLAGGTLAERLHGGASSSPLPWRHRMRILHDVAAALEHLHDGSPPVVHGDVSASNVLLGAGAGSVRLCDLGSACEGFSAAVAPTRAAVGSPGYVDPFFLRTGIVSKKSDVYSFGVLLLEAITGSPAAGSVSGNLTARLLPRVRAEGVEMGVVVDRRLGDEYDVAEAGDVARIAVECVAAQPGLRPTMAHVRKAIAEKAASSISIAAAADHGLHGSNST
uniref:Protein kinase domain-containing protein n=1 Tax=Leersia perrieri TaxID=77586 RepID=A0A0D9VB62_9ORYZ